jgi:diglucosylglycerate octanoyltransferase
MSEAPYSEAALARRQEKFAYAENFPGLLRDWSDAEGKRVESVAPLGEGALVLFEDGTFFHAVPGPVLGDPLLRVLEESRPALSRHRARELAELDRRIAAEQEAMRLARMEKVLGAVRTNLPHIPELREELIRLLEDLRGDEETGSFLD